MAFVFSVGGGKDFKKVPVGVWVARCFRMVDMGTQVSTGQWAGKASRKIHVEWEVFGDDEDGPLTIEINGKSMPLTISKSYTASMNEKATLRKELQAWRGKPFTDEEAAQFDVSKLVGAYCMLNITHSESGNGKVYANIAGISPVPAALKNSKPAGVHKDQVFDLNNPNMDVYESLPKWLQDKIAESPEFDGAAQLETAGAEEDGDIPF